MTLTTFDIESASRIAGVVRAVEGEPQRTRPLVFDGLGQSSAKKVFRVGTFTGAWAKSATKAVTVSGGRTVSAKNLFAEIASNTAARNCAIARDGTAWYVIAAEC
jgi:hypothetical protein